MARPLEKKLPQLMTARMIRDETGLPASTVRTLCDRLPTVHSGAGRTQRLFRRDDVFKLLSPPDSRWRSID